ncbi:hypothetical protein BDP27DRAFT_1339844 [Rhodocollybia butyracea]|uniref:Uncharacterized protein n=1 Tax=Rhodocollybia butyracea TaxID=206335 RepID=A0A9P5U095_9AGAR|nr:hypothetical protein BDP27DRAFT_1339844 [Rhodocollybia butyracea]
MERPLLTLRGMLFDFDSYHSPHSLQLYPDSVIHPLLQLADELSFVHLRSLTIDSGPQVLYFLGSEPFGGIISSAAACLEDITFCGHNSMRNSDIKRMLNQHSFSCVRFPCLRRISFQGLFELGVTNGRRMWCTLDLTRNLYDGTPSVSPIGAASVDFAINCEP